jgi:hypothetical protein
MVDFAVQKALHELRQGLLYGFWIVQRYGFEPALAGALGNSFGVALVLAVVKMAEAQSAAGWTLAAGAVFVPVLACGCVDDGHWAFVCFWVEGYPPPPTFCKLFRISGFAGFRLQFLADKSFGSSPHGIRSTQPVARRLIFFRARFHDVRVCGGAQV